jgi:hypothetical protein
MIFAVYRQSEFNLALRRLRNADGEATTTYRKITTIHEIAAILKAIRQLTGPPEKPRREIEYHVREKTARYRTHKGA